MFIAHLPAGYILAKHLKKKNNFRNKSILQVTLFGSIFPDLDLVYFYLIDNRQTLHHDYWIHTPFYWFVIYLMSISLAKLLKLKKYSPFITAFHLGIFLHLILDTYVGKINWFFPFSKQSFAIFEVPERYDSWILNFVLHWSFILELAILVYALIIFFNLKNPTTKTIFDQTSE